jgi:hypothetical protein
MNSAAISILNFEKIKNELLKTREGLACRS